MYVNDVSEASYVRLMSSDNETTVKNLAMFVHDALKQRDSFLEGNYFIYLLNSQGKIITLCMYMLTTTSYIATMSTLKYCIILCAWAGGLTFRNKLN